MTAIPYKKIVPPRSLPPRTVSGTRPAQRIDPKGQLIDGKLIDGRGRAAPAPSHARVEVELNIFSDRPNPRWLLAKARSDVLLSHLPKQSSLVPAAVNGYRGFTVYVESEAGKRTVHVFHDTELERWLLTSGRFCIPDDLAAYVEKQLA